MTQVGLVSVPGSIVFQLLNKLINFDAFGSISHNRGEKSEVHSKCRSPNKWTVLEQDRSLHAAQGMINKDHFTPTFLPPEAEQKERDNE